MNKRIFALILVAVVLLSGCQLAKPEAQEDAAADMLVGVFLTTEFLHTYDAEEILQGYLQNGQLTPDAAGNNRIYATFEETVVDGVTTGQYTFPGLEGILLASFRMVPHGNNANAYWSTAINRGICDVAAGHYSRDNGYDLTLSGTVYVMENYPEHLVFYHNPVFQTRDGQVYVVPGDGVSFATELAGACSHKTQAAADFLLDGTEISCTSEIEVHIQSVRPGEKIRILHMSGDNRLLEAEEYGLSDLPKSVAPMGAYVIVEEHLSDGTLRRSLCQDGDRCITVFTRWEGGICEKTEISLEWK